MGICAPWPNTGPIGRLGTAEEIAATAALLASDEVRLMTGANIIIDGGMSL